MHVSMREDTTRRYARSVCGYADEAVVDDRRRCSGNLSATHGAVCSDAAAVEGS